MTAPTAAPGSLSMLELVAGMLSRDHPRATEFAAEVQSRWEASRAQLRTDDVWNEDLDEWLHSASPDQLAPVEQARQYLAALTLIYELWVLQEADVRPDGLWASQYAPTRVHEILRREMSRVPSPFDGPEDNIDPLGSSASWLALWADLALFGDARRLIDQHYLLAGDLRYVLPPEHLEVCAQALAELRGPWSLPEFLASPVGKDYYRPQQPTPPSTLAGLDVALGRRGALITEADVIAAQVATDAAIGREAQRVAAEEPFEPTADLDPTRAPRDHLVGVHGAMRDMELFLSLARGLQDLAADRTMRVDGRPVPADLENWVLYEHYQAAAFRPPGQRRPASTISIAGMRLRFTTPPEIGVVMAEAEVAGKVNWFLPDSLGGILAILDQPDALYRIAKIRQGVDQLGDALAATESTSSAADRLLTERRAATHPGSIDPRVTGRGRS